MKKFIVDACVGNEYGNPPTARAFEVMKALARGEITVVTGGQLTEELKQCSFRAIMVQLRLAGRLFEYAVNTLETCTLAAGVRSNDTHVLKLALVSGARILHTEDGSLRSDFLDARIIANPRGKIFSRPEHKRLWRVRRR